MSLMPPYTTKKIKKRSAILRGALIFMCHSRMGHNMKGRLTWVVFCYTIRPSVH